MDTTSDKIIVYHLETSRSSRIIYALEELGLPYEVKAFKRVPPDMMAPPELAKIHPSGHAPLIKDGSDVLAESGAILEYLSEKKGGQLGLPSASGTPEERRCRNNYRFYMHFAEGSLMPYLLLKFSLAKAKERSPWLFRPIMKKVQEGFDVGYINPNITRSFKMIDTDLSKSDYLAGKHQTEQLVFQMILGDQLTMADIQLLTPMDFCSTGAFGQEPILRESEYPNIGKWLHRMRARPAFKVAEKYH